MKSFGGSGDRKNQRYFDDIPAEDLPVLLTRAVADIRERTAAKIYNTYKNDSPFDEIARRMWLEPDELHEMLSRTEKLIGTIEVETTPSWRLSDLV